KQRKIVRKKPPEKGYVHWDRATFERLVTSTPEPLVSRFSVSYGMLLNVLSRGKGGCKAMARLIRSSDERRAQQRIIGKTAAQMFRSLLDAHIVELAPDRGVIVNADLQEDFSLNHALSLYLLHAIELLERDSETYSLDLLTLVESILENPDLVLIRQLDKLKTEKMAELKAGGVEYDERIAALDKLEYPKPNRDFIYDTFNAFVRLHPWIAAENIRPKSIAREMFEMFLSFPEYVKEYGLERGEGVLLRYLSQVYKTLTQTVPAPAKTPEVDDIVTYFGAIVRAVDSSLLDEWERLHDGAPDAGTAALAIAAEAPGEADVTRSPKEFTVLVRNAVFAVLRALARKDYVGVTNLLVPSEWTRERIEAVLAPFWAEHASIRLDPKARAPTNTKVTPGQDESWAVQQIIWDEEEANDWALDFRVDLIQSRAEARAVLKLVDIVS
ncbi:MAG TPA: DUF3516 domain-containing protein, partial [Polyangiaceae bacterium]|nr:DUF3516 domain-containing protein [Polyangiaceae bacterium]